MDSQAAISLAILKVNWDELKGDYIQNFVPFVADIIVSKFHLAGTPVSIQGVQAELSHEFGAEIPRNALNTIINRMVRQGYLEKLEGGYSLNISKLKSFDLSKTRQLVLREHNALIERLTNYVKTKHGVDWNIADAEQALYSFVSKHQIGLLGLVLSGRLISEPRESVKRREYLLYRFIIYLYENDPNGLKYLETVVKGNLLANVLWFPNISHVQSKFERTEIYCDTAFLMRSLGHNGSFYRDSCNELLNLFYEKGAELRCFQHTLTEIKGNLYAIGVRF